MNTQKLCLNSIVIAVLVSLVLWTVGCNKTGGASKDPNVDYYTCTMHPSVKSQDPKGKCPICSMDLVPVMKKGADAGAGSHPHDAMAMSGGTKMAAGPMFSEFSVPVERQQQIGVTYAVAEKMPLRHTIRSVGMVVPDRSRQWGYVARVEGYVQKLYVTSPGEAVKEGAPLLTIYSPDLLTAERELVSLLDVRDRASSPESRASAERLIEAARRRLEQWNIGAKQISDLEKARKPSEFLTLNSPFDGVVQDVPVDQGRKVMIGDPLVSVADLSVVWLWAEFYENELAMLEKGLKVRLTTKSYPGQTFEGEISLVNPFLDETRRTTKVRVDIQNAERKLRPGMYLNIELAMDMGEGLTIPVSAVMPTGLRTLVFVDKGEGKLEPRPVQLGGKYGDSYEVQSGLAEGERVVSSANFLIDAESKVQGAVRDFEKQGRNDETARRRIGDDARKPMKPIRHFRDLDVYQNALETGLRVFELSKRFPTDERYALTDQIRRSSRSVCANIAEAWRKRRYEAAFIAKLSDAETEAAETQVHAEFAFRHGYLSREEFEKIDDACEKVAAQIVRIIEHPEKWLIRRPKL